MQTKHQDPMKHIKPHQFFVRHSAFVGMAVVVTCLLSGNLAQAAPTGLLYLPLTGVHGAGTTMTSVATDSKGTNFSAGTTVTLGLYSATAGTGPTDLHGASGSGVLGVGGALDCTGGGTATGSPSSANYNAQDKADANLHLQRRPALRQPDQLHRHILVQPSRVAGLANTIGPRLFILQNSTTAYGDTGVANSIGVKFQTATPGQLYFAINGNNPVGGPLRACPAFLRTHGSSWLLCMTAPISIGPMVRPGPAAPWPARSLWPPKRSL